MLVVIRSMPRSSSAVTAVRIRPTSTGECGFRESTVALLIGYLFVIACIQLQIGACGRSSHCAFVWKIAIEKLQAVKKT